MARKIKEVKNITVRRRALHSSISYCDVSTNMLIITQYTEQGKIECSDITTVINTSKEPIKCPKCNGILHPKDHVPRHTRNDEGIKQWHKIRRLKCNKCNAIHRELPNYMMPYKHYESGIIETVIDEKPSDCAAENSTFFRWRCWFAKICGLLESHLTAIRMAIRRIHTSLVASTSVLKEMREFGSGWLANAMHMTINAGYPAYTEFAFCRL